MTGAGRGQGRSHALHLAREGAAVVACGIEQDLEVAKYPVASPGDLEETARLVTAEGHDCVAVAADVRSLAEMEHVVDVAIERFGHVDIMVANAGVMLLAPVQEMSAEEWGCSIDVLLTGTFNALRAVAPHFVSQESGRFIAISSAVGKRGTANVAGYAAAKWGVIGLVKTAAIDLGPYGVTCNAICPGYVDTPMINNDLIPPLFFPDEERPTMAMLNEFIATNEHTLPVGALDPSEVSKAVVFLSSDDASYISGSTLDVSAGMVATTAS